MVRTKLWVCWGLGKAELKQGKVTQLKEHLSSVHRGSPGFHSQHLINRAWWHTSLILVLETRQEDGEFKVIFNHMMKSRLAWAV